MLRVVFVAMAIIMIVLVIVFMVMTMIVIMVVAVAVIMPSLEQVACHASRISRIDLQKKKTLSKVRAGNSFYLTPYIRAFSWMGNH